MTRVPAASPPDPAPPPVAPTSPTSAAAAAPPADAQVAANLAAGAAVVAALRPDGDAPRHVVVAPGARSAPLVLALAEVPWVRLWSVLDERAAGFFALGLARADGRAVVLVCTSGSAGLHFAPAVAEAAAAASPLLVLTADRPAESQGCGAAQTMAQAGMYGALVPPTVMLPPPAPGLGGAVFAARVAQALAVAEGSPAGPVHLNLPFREPLWDGRATVPAYQGPLPRYARARARLPDLASLARRLAAAERVLVCCGPRPAAADGFAAAVQALAAAHHWPLLAEPASQAAAGAAAGPPSPRLAAADAWLRGAAGARALVPDLVLRFGAWPTSRPVGAAVAAAGAGRTVHVEPDGRCLDPSHGGAEVVCADPAAACLQLRDLLPPGPSTASAWARGLMARDHAAAAALAAAAAGPALSGPSVARAVVQQLLPGAALHLASSLAVRDVDAFGGALPAATRVFHQRGLSGIDGTLAAALGEACGGAAPLTVLLGDLAFWHDVSALLLAPRLAGRAVTAVVVDNGGGGIFDHLPVAAHRDYVALFRTPERADIVRACAGLAVPCVRVAAVPALLAALAAPHPGGLRVIVAAVAAGPEVHREAVAAALAAADQAAADQASRTDPAAR